MTTVIEVYSADGETPEQTLEKIIQKKVHLYIIGYNIDRIPRNINEISNIESITLKNANLYYKRMIAVCENNNVQNAVEYEDRSVEIFEPLLKIDVKRLVFKYCKLHRFPSEIFSVLNVESVHIMGIDISEKLDITGLCYCRSLQKLEISDIDRNMFNENIIIPKEICLLTNLTHLSIKYCIMSEIPAAIGELTSLTKLELVFGALSIKTNNILCDFSRLQKLENLHLSGFYGITFPYSIGFLNSLKNLNIRLNNLKKFPSFVLNLPMLELLQVEYIGANDMTPYLYGGRDIIYIYAGHPYSLTLNIRDYRMYWILIHEISIMSGLPFGDLARMCDFHINSPNFCKSVPHSYKLLSLYDR